MLESEGYGVEGDKGEKNWDNCNSKSVKDAKKSPYIVMSILLTIFSML